MFPYIFVFIFLSIISLLHFTNCTEKQKSIFFYFSVFVLVAFSGLRNNGVGADDVSYFNFFLHKTPDLYDWVFGDYEYSLRQLYMEPGFVFVNSFLRVFTDNYIFLFLTVSTLSVGIAAYNYKKYSKYFFLTLVLFFVHTYLYRDLNQIRSAVAAGLSLILISSINDRKHLKVWLTLLVAGSFHIASLSLFFAYIASFFKITRKRVFFIYVVALVFGVFGASKIFIQVVPSTGFLAAKLYSYTENKNYANAISFFDVTNVKNSFILIMILVFWHRLKKVVPYFETIVLFYLFAVVIRVAFWDLGVLAARISTFFAIVEVVIIPYFIVLFKQKKLVYLIILLYAFTMLYMNLFLKDGRNPYDFSVFNLIF